MSSLAVSAFVGVTLLLAGCSDDGDENPGGRAATSDGPDVTIGESSDTVADSDGVAGPLGFEVDRFEIPIPEVAIEEPPEHITPPSLPTSQGSDVPFAAVLDGTGAFDGAEELIAAGVDAGVWSEIEGVRALMSIVMGELPPDAVAGFDEIAHPSIHYVLERAALLLEDESSDERQRADLSRLTSVFLKPGPTGEASEDDGRVTPNDTEPEGLVRPQGLRVASGLPRAGVGGCGLGQPGNEGFFKVDTSSDTEPAYRFCTAERGADTVVYPVARGDDGDIWERSADRLFELIDQARTGYLSLVQTEMPPVKFLISPRPDPAGIAAGHVLSNRNGPECIGAIFATDSLFAQDFELDNTMAHELFHCVQSEWEGKFASSGQDFVEEAGASYFAYRLLGQCAPGEVARGPRLDARSASGSLLEMSYESWFFWAYLDEHGKLDPAQIGQLHRSVKAGMPVGEAMRSFIPDVDRTMNEFYVRLLGPGLACGFQGWRVTGERSIEDVGDVTFADAAWQGTRYEVTYVLKWYIAQSRGDGLPIGMAESQESPDTGAWVQVEPEIRTECDDGEEWYVVLATSGEDDATSPDRLLKVTERQDAECDPCPIGTWSFDLDDMAQFWESFAPAGQSTGVTIGGAWTLQFAGATGAGPTVIADDQAITLTFTVQGNSINLDVVGGGGGQWTGDESTLGVSDYQSSGTGTFMDISGSSSSTDSAALGYTCDDDVLSIQANGTTIGLTRIDPAKGTSYFE